MSNDSGLVPSSTPGPSSDTPITLPSGTVVRVRNLVILKKLGGPNALTIYIETPTLEADGAQLAREAQELVTMHDTFAESQGIATIAVAVCRTRECSELREAPSEYYRFSRAENGGWVASTT